ncbi:MAG TPA: hypothetical protein VF624_18215 [Tepidisphaeraceae bacterium]
MLFFALAQATPSNIDNAASLGVAGLMGAMWLWERRTSADRDRQLDESHARVAQDAIKVETLVALVEQNTAALTRVLAATDRVLQKLQSDM